MKNLVHLSLVILIVVTTYGQLLAEQVDGLQHGSASNTTSVTKDAHRANQHTITHLTSVTEHNNNGATTLNKHLTANTNQDGIKLVLMGIVIDKTKQQPVENALVELEDPTTKEVRQFTTIPDGHFYFGGLASDKKYNLYVLDDDGKKQDIKEIKTIGKYEPEILRAILQVRSQEVVEDRGQGTFEQRFEMDYANAVYDMPLAFKIQVGAFHSQLPPDSDFMRSLDEEIILLNTEETTNGYIRYMIGEYKSLEEARNVLVNLQNRGYDKAYIVPYYKAERINKSPERVLQEYQNGLLPR